MGERDSMCCTSSSRVSIALPSYDNVDIFGFERLFGEQRGVPATKNNWEIGIPRFNGLGDFRSFANHRTGHKRDRKAERITNFFEYALLKIRRDRGVN